MNGSMKWQELWPSLIGLGGAFLVALGIAIYVMQAPYSDIQHLAQFLITSSIPSLLIGYLLFLIGRRWLRRIQQKLLLAYGLGIVIALINIFVTSQLMFVSQHDFLLLGLLLVFAGLLSTSFGYLLASRLTRSLKQLQQGANQLAAGDFSTQVHVSEQDELAEVAEAFNMMVDELQRSFARQKELERARRDLIAAVSHDLRTPLTSIRVMTEALVDGMVTDEAMAQRYYTNIYSQVESLSNLINDLFELSKLEGGQLELQLEPVNLNELLSEVIESMQPQAQVKEISLRGMFSEDLPAIQAEFAKIQRVLYNLIQNAIRHTPAQGSVSLATRRVPQGVQVEVADTGEGINPEDLPYIFDQFFRGEKSRSRETGGAGLGLAIAKRIIEAHQGKIWAESEPDRETRFNFILPVS